MSGDYWDILLIQEKPQHNNKHNNKTNEAVILLFRSVIKPTDIVKFDEKISPHELKALRERLSETDSDDDLNMDTNGQ